MLRRLEKRILVDLPSTEARKYMFETFLPPTIERTAKGAFQLTCEVDYDEVASVSIVSAICMNAHHRGYFQ